MQVETSQNIFRTTRVLKKLLYAFHENPEVFAE